MIREPVVSGRFYPGTKRELLAALDASWSHDLGVRREPVPQMGRLRGIIVPHAGYMFSGPTASWGYQRLLLERPQPQRFLLLGPKHTPYGAAAALSRATAWRTPLGDVLVDDALRRSLNQSGVFVLDDQAHAHEHSIEVQLPFLQKICGTGPLSVVPLALMYADFATCQAWAAALRKVIELPENRDVMLVISSDFSHETPRREAYRLDGEAISLLEKGDAAGFHRLVLDEDRSICGFIPITVAILALAGERQRISRLTYATSMDIHPSPTGVGYAAIALEEVEPSS